METDHPSGQDSLQKYRNLFENAVVGIFRSKIDGSAFLDVNQALCNQLGYTREELLSQPAANLWAEPAAREQMVGQLRREGSIVNHEAGFVSKSGEIRHALVSARLYPEDGSIEGSATDITERKRAEEALSKAKAFNEVLIQASPAFFVAISPEVKTLMMNEAMLQALGYSLDEVVGKDYLTTFVPESDREMLSKVFQALERTRKPTHNENYILARDGRQLLVEWHGRFVFKKNGELDFFFGVGIDITERKKAEEALKESEERFRDLTENTTDWIWEVDDQMRCVYASPRIKDIIGYSPEEVIGKKALDFIPPEDAELIPASWDEMIHNPKPWRSLEYRVLHKDGSMKVLESSGIPIFDKDGHFIGYRGIDRDVTERKCTEHLLEVSQKKFFAAFHDSPAPMVITEAESGKTIEANPAALCWTGYSYDETIGRSAVELGFMSKEDRERFAREISKKGYVDAREIKFRTRHGEIRDIIHSSKLMEIDNKLCIISHLNDITDQRRMEEELKKYQVHLEELVEERTTELEQKRRGLEDMNAALKVLLKQREKDRTDIQKDIMTNLQVSVLPYVSKLESAITDNRLTAYLREIQSNLNMITSSFVREISSGFIGLTPNEIQIASLIKEGRTSKEISDMLNISLNTVHTYRKRIRAKSGLKNKKIDLRSHLKTWK